MGNHELTCIKRRPKMKNYFIKIQLALVLSNFVLIECKLSDERLCADPDCSVLLGVGKTVLKYFAKDEGMLSFANNKPVKIFSKGAGSNPNLWGVMIDGKRGYVNKAHVQEQRVYRKDLEFTVPTEFSKPAPIEEKADEKTEEEEKIPYEAEIEKTEELDDKQLETKQQELQPSAEQVPEPEISSSLSASVDSTATATPPIDSSTPPSAQQQSVTPEPAQPVQPDSVDFEVVDGTTIYFDGPPPKINEAPSMDNVTPEAISPTMTQARAEPTESSKAPEIESSVSENHDVVEKPVTAVLSDNPGGAIPTANAVDGKSKDMDSTEPITEEIKTAAYDLGGKDPDNNPKLNMADKIQVDKPIEENIPFTTEDDQEIKEGSEGESNTKEIEKEDEGDEDKDDESMEAEEIDSDEMDEEEGEGDNDYLDDLSDEERIKIQKKIEEMKMKSVETKDVDPEKEENDDEAEGDTEKEIVTEESVKTNPSVENNEQTDIPYSVDSDSEVQKTEEVVESIEKFTVQSSTSDVETLHPEENELINDANKVPMDTANQILDSTAQVENKENTNMIDNNQIIEKEKVNSKPLTEETEHKKDAQESESQPSAAESHQEATKKENEHSIVDQDQSKDKLFAEDDKPSKNELNTDQSGHEQNQNVQGHEHPHDPQVSDHHVGHDVKSNLQEQEP